ncbi:apolipoprotein A1/A4/E domain-containing protein [Caulobacter mirabilis]|uniref:Polar localization protein TipN n=1 Tax=Caulobacter mirabilis TaxID=69666 RepID=A0A2D2B0G9_9CAUL|nr:apolipoprotein A1/A4/E domain-containing protein [Caulobacter mirabilis]ATQ43733.1 polar localization protein TipN [Caulobacter mirabilis]
MKARKTRAPLDFSRMDSGLSAEAQPAEAAPEAPAVEPDLEIQAAPAVEMAEPEAPPPAALTRPAAEPPLPPALRGQPAKLKPTPAWPVWLAAAVAAVLWAGCTVAFALGWRANIVPLNDDPFAMALFAVLFIAPTALVFVAAYLVRKGQELSQEVRYARDLAGRMLAPAAQAAAETGGAVESVRLQIDSATAAAHEARETMLALRQALAEETERLAEAAATSARTASELAVSLGQERSQLGELSGQLDARSVAVSDAITQQARMVAEASDLAETQLREAEAALAARAADLAAAAGEASDAARVAGEDLARQVARLETAGVGVGDQMRLVEEGLTHQRAALVTVAHALRADQEDFAAQAETKSAQLSEFMVQATESATNIGEQAARGAETLSQLITEASERFGGLTQQARLERDALNDESSEALAKVGEAAARERAILESDLQSAIGRLTSAAQEARVAAEGHHDAARARVDELSEAAFTAHQKADAIFEARLRDARDLIEQSAQLVEQAGAATVQKLEQGTVQARAVLAELERLIDDVAARAEDLPEAAKGRVEEVRASVEQSMDDLLSAARRAADEAQTIDAAFQERVRRNYDMLSEAVKVMGVVSGSASAAAPAFEPKLRGPIRTPEPPKPIVVDTLPDDPAMRPRLKLTPTATDEEFRAVFESAGGRAAAPAAPAAEGEGGWSWRDLLTSIDGDESDSESLAERMAAEIAAMGIDPSALLPKSRIEEVAAAIQRNDRQSGREVVRRLAPAAIRRLVRRLFSDAAMRGQTDRFIERFGGMLEEAAERDRGGVLVSALLASDGGRAWLLLDAAAGELG